MPESKRLIPIELEYERALLGAMLMWRRSDDHDWDLDDVRGVVQAESFSVPDHQAIFRTVCAVYDAGDPIECASVVQRLKAEPGDIDWLELTGELAESFADVANAMFYARGVRKQHQLREIIRVLNASINKAYAPLAEPGDIVATLEKKLERIDDTGADRPVNPMSEILAALPNPRNEHADKIPVGLGHLGRTLCDGLDRGSLTIIGARPGCGKTSLALGLARYAADSSKGCPVLFVSAEMKSAEIGLRELSAVSGIPLAQLRRGGVDDQRFTADRNYAVLHLENSQAIFVDDCTASTHAKDARVIASRARRHVRKDCVGLILLDYLGLLTITGEYDRHDLRVGTIVRVFKNLARETNTAVVLLVQLNREAPRQSRKPVLSDLKDSGEIEQHADNVILIHAPSAGQAVEAPRTAPDLVATELIVAKQRQGGTGACRVVYDTGTLVYKEPAYDPKLEGPPPPLSVVNAAR